MKLSETKIMAIKNSVDKMFTRLEKSGVSDNKQSVIDDFKLGKFEIERDRYPEIKFTIDANDIAELRRKKIIDDDNRLNPDIASGAIAASPLEKLLYSILWKNIDLGKERSIINGVLAGDAGFPDTGIVFHQFGKYLANHDEPIIDQHVMRCYLIRNETGVEVIDRYVSMDAIPRSQRAAVTEYIDWIKHVTGNNVFSKCDIDEILFAFGRYIKKTGS